MSKERKIKCVVWDLDNTVWNGVLLEDGDVTLRDGIEEIIRTLDERGILQSVSSKNEYGAAMKQLEAFGLDEYFLYPQIHWNAKSGAVRKIAEEINIGLDTLAFVDDQAFEREEVAYGAPEVLCIDANDLSGFLELPELNPRFLTDDSKLRRQMYRSDILRKQIEEEFEGPQDEFLASLGMKFTISEAAEEDLQRAEELTVRTNQLNSTGYTYSYEELNGFRHSERHKLLIAGLEDKYGTYGKIGLVLLEMDGDVWTIKLLLMSCRVMSRGVGTILIQHLRLQAREHGARLRAEFLSTDRNRMMYITYKFAGFNELEKDGDLVLFENDLSTVQPFPDYVRVDIG